MLAPEERALVTNMGDKLLELYAKRDEAIRDGNLEHVHRLQTKISEVAAERQDILQSVERDL
jgi:molybdenum-dependent DNA-binding transcriptional regulator ModE